MKKIIINSFVLITLIMMGCNDNSVRPEPIMEDGSYGILPLKVGNTWEYQQYVLKKDGSILREGNRIRYKIIGTSYDPSHKILEPVYNMSLEWLDTTYNPVLIPVES